MASATLESTAQNRLSLESIPTVDLRLLSQSELAALSMCSPRAFDLSRCDDVVIPIIDRSVFNESAGSRKQTYSRLRLAPRNSNLSSSKSRTPAIETLDDSEREDNSRIISLFKQLFNSSSSGCDSIVPVNVDYSDALGVGPSNAVVVPQKRQRKSKSEIDGCGVNEEGKVLEEIERRVVNKNGMVIDLGALGNMDDPYGDEIKRRTNGMERPEELLGVLTDLKGQWGSRRKKRKIIDANEFGDALPNGWKVLMGMKKKQGRAWLFCRRYISPTGRYFMSCKEVSSYLLSLISPPQDSGMQMSIQGTEDSMVVDAERKNAPPLQLALQSARYENQQTPYHVSQVQDHEKQVILSNNDLSEEGQVSLALKCHKCSTPFDKKDGLLNHLLSCHKRKRRKAGEPIEDDVMMKDGKYECQFCNRIFYERNIYFAHVGLHVKNYARSIGGLPDVASKQKACDPISVGGFAANVSDTPGLVDANADSLAESPNIPATGESNLCFIDSKLKVGSDAETHSKNCVNDQGNMAVRPEMNVEAAQNDITSTDESCDKQDGIVHTSQNKVGEVDEPVVVSAVKSDFCADSEKMFSNENNSCGYSGQINATEYAVSEKTCPSSVVVENAETCLLSDSSPVDLGNKGNFDSVSDIYYEGGVSEVGLPAINEENTSQNSGDIILGNSAVDDSKYCEGVKEDNDDLVVEFSEGHLDLDMVTEDDVQHSGSVKDSSVCSVVSYKEEEICDLANNEIDFRDSKLTDYEMKRTSEACPPPSRDQLAVGSQTYVGDGLMGLMDETEAEVKVDGVCSIGQARQTEDDSTTYTGNISEKVPAAAVLEPQGRGDFLVEQTCDLEKSTDMPLGASVVNDDEQRNISLACSPIHSAKDKSHTDISTVLESYNNFLDNNQPHDPKNILSGISCNEHMHEVTIDNISTVCGGAATRQPPELDKVDNSHTNKLILDFSSMTDMNERYLTSVPDGSSPFSLWGESVCVESNQTCDYGIAKGVNKRQNNYENNSLNFIGLQQPCDDGYNLNKVGVDGQGFNVQHSETGFYSRDCEARGEGPSHGNSLNLGGFQQCDARYNSNKPCEQNFGVQHDEAKAYSTSGDTGQERVTYGNSLSLASIQPTCDAGYSLNKDCVQQTCETRYNLNKGYNDPLQGLSRLGGLEHSRDRDLMVGFGNNTAKSNQGIETDFLWRPTEGNVLHGNSVDSSSEAQSSGFFRAFDFLSDKSGNDLGISNEKVNMSRFEGLRPTSVEPMEFSFLTTQNSNAQMEDPKVLPYNTQMDQGFGGSVSTEMDQGFGSSVWQQKGTSVPNRMSGHGFSVYCVWCTNEFHQDSLGCEMQAGSIGYLCPSCKARMSGQFL